MDNKEYQKKLEQAKKWQATQRKAQKKYANKKRKSNIKKLKNNNLKKTMGKRKYKKKSNKQKLTQKLDDLWSLKVREGGKCELCGEKGDINSFDAHHIKSRGHRSTRWDVNNGVCLCKGCHRFKVHMDTFTVSRLIDKLKKERGEKWYKDLVKRADNKTKLYIKDLRDIKKLAKKDNWEEVNKIIEQNFL